MSHVLALGRRPWLDSPESRIPGSGESGQAEIAEHVRDTHIGLHDGPVRHLTEGPK